MQKKTRFKSPARDFAVVILGLAVAISFLFLFWKDLNATSVRTDKKQIATITFKNKIAQRKFSDRVVWERLSNSSPLYDGDVIRTANLAQAIITFHDGTTLDLSENTMLQIYFSEYEGLQIFVDGGDIQLDAAKNANVAVKLDDGSVVNVDAGSSLIAKAEPQGVKTIEVKTGNAKITTEIGKTASLSLGQSANIEKSGNIERNPITVTSIPRDLRLLNVTDKPLDINLEWKMNDDKSQFITIETSDDKDFSAITATKRIRSTEKHTLSIDQGTVWWRLYSDENKKSPVIGKIAVQKVPPVKKLAPSSNGQFSYRVTPPAISFRWDANELANHYKLTVSSTPDMKNPIVERKIENSNIAIVTDLREGTWWWQISPYYIPNNLGYIISEKPSSFTIIKNSQIKKPSLTVPQDKAEIVYKENIPLQLMWKSDLNDCTYVVHIAKDSAFKNEIFTKETTSTSFNQDFAPTDLKDGIYFWKIVRKSQEKDDLTPESDIRSFIVSKYVPQSNKLLYPPERFTAETGQIATTSFVWKLSDDYKDKESVLQISKSKDFSTIQQEKHLPEQTISNINIEEGTWYWRIGVMNDAGTIDYTPSRSFVAIKELTAPQLIYPAQNQELLTYNDSAISLKWKEVSGASYYNVRIYNQEQELISSKQEIRDTKASFILKPEKYSVELQAVAEQNDISTMRQSPYSQAEFAVRKPEPVILLSPASSSTISGLTALRIPTSFTWKNGKDIPSEYELVLKKRTNNGSYKVIERRTTDKQSISFHRLTPGSYSYQVLASTAQGIPLNSGEKSFTVTDVPPLATPVGLSPRDNFTMNGEYLRKKRNIVFEWKPVEGANSYNFVLYKKDQDGSLKAIYSEKKIKSNRARLKDLSVLDLGSFSWQVTAYSYAKDGYLEQSSKTLKQSFKIDFEAPSEIENLTPERMYSE